MSTHQNPRRPPLATDSSMADEQLCTRLGPITWAWLALVALTLISLELGQWLQGAAWLPLVVAVIIWYKGWLVARSFIEAPLTHVFVRRVLRAFIAFAPLALILIAFYGREFARLTTL